MGIHAEYTLPFDRDAVWRWHTRPGAVTRLTPGFLPMLVASEAASIRSGITVFRLPAGQKWVARHLADGYVAGHQFTDVAANQPVAPRPPLRGRRRGHIAYRRRQRPHPRSRAPPGLGLPSAPAGGRLAVHHLPASYRPEDGGHDRLQRPRRHPPARAADHRRTHRDPAGARKGGSRRAALGHGQPCA